MYKIRFFVLFIFLIKISIAQQLIEKSAVHLRLQDGLVLTCYKANSLQNTGMNHYYYVPVNIRFSNTNSGDKAYSIMIYKDKNNQIKGGIMHWLLSWGVSRQQLAEARRKLKTLKGKNAQLEGAVLPDKTNTGTDFEITGNTSLAGILQAAVVSRGNVPLVSNAKMAIAFKFSKKEASGIEKLFSNYREQKNTYVTMRFLLHFKKPDGNMYDKELSVKQNLQNLLYH